MPRPARIEVTDANQSYWKFGDYAYDGAGNITMIGNTTYQYDDVNRLRRHATWSGNKFYSATTYDYDRYGNRIGSFNDGCASNGRCFASLPSHLPIAATSNHNNTHTHDDSGSITSDGKYNFGYDATAMMTSLTGIDRNERYLYTAGDERVAVVRNIGSGRRTTWSIRALDNHLLRSWTDDTTTGTRQFTWSEDEIWRGSTLLASDSPTGLKRYHLDHLGSPRLVTNGAGVRIGEQTFDPFGTGGTLDGGRLQFTGHERDIPASGSGLVLDYMHARYYDGAGGRFLSVDPGKDWDPKQPQSWNMYAYVRNNPLNRIDPTGRTCSDPNFIGPCRPTAVVTLAPPRNAANWTPQQRAAENAKNAHRAQLAEEGKLVVNRNQVRPSSAQMVQVNGGAAPAGMHIDHPQDLVLMVRHCLRRTWGTLTGWSIRATAQELETL
jgi:RHS repeat-associated protein